VAVNGGVATEVDELEGVIWRSQLDMYFLSSSKSVDTSFLVTAWSHSSLSLGENDMVV